MYRKQTHRVCLFRSTKSIDGNGHDKANIVTTLSAFRANWFNFGLWIVKLVIKCSNDHVLWFISAVCIHHQWLLWTMWISFNYSCGPNMCCASERFILFGIIKIVGFGMKIDWKSYWIKTYISQYKNSQFRTPD